jgi:hypothetical protein
MLDWKEFPGFRSLLYTSPNGSALTAPGARGPNASDLAPARGSQGQRLGTVTVRPERPQGGPASRATRQAILCLATLPISLGPDSPAL